MENILLIIPELGKGGAENSLLKLSAQLATRYKVYLCVFHTQVKVPYPVTVDLIDLHTPPTTHPLQKLFYIITRIRAIRKIKRQLMINVSISFLEGADYLNVLTKGREKVITSLRGSKTYDQEISGWLGKLRRKILIPWLYKKSDCIVTVSKMLAQEMHQDYHIPRSLIKCIPNFYDIASVMKMASEPLAPVYQGLFTTQVIIHSGRFHPQKEQMALISIFKLVRQQRSARLILLGDGALRISLKQHAKSLGLKVCDVIDHQPEVLPDADVYLLGFRQNPFQFIARAAMFAFPSSWEGFPNALAEAMLCRVPVVSADCPTGPREILAPDTALESYANMPEETPYGWLMPLVNTQDETMLQQWAEVMLQVLKGFDTAKIEAAFQRMQSYSVASVCEQWDRVIEDVDESGSKCN